jgi:hypothetical protein
MNHINGMVVSLFAFSISAMACVTSIDHEATGDPSLSISEAQDTGTTQQSIGIANVSNQPIFVVNTDTPVPGDRPLEGTHLQGTVITPAPSAIGANHLGQILVDVPVGSVGQQFITYSTKPSSPLTGKTCQWSFSVSFNFICVLSPGPTRSFGSASCESSPFSSIDATTCKVVFSGSFR